MTQNFFLYRVASYYYNKYGKGINQVCFIFPSKRAINFFTHYLQALVERPIFAPKCLTINEFISEQKPTLRILDETELLFELYDNYQRLYYERTNSPAESFDKFVYWGRLILKDFDLIDRYLINSKHLFSNIHDYHELNDDFSYLDEETKKLIKEFWEGFHRDENLEYSKRFFDFWDILPQLYEEFNQSLQQQNKCYEGHLYRLINEDNNDCLQRLKEQTKYERYAFIGFFGLSLAERLFFKQLKVEGLAEFIWNEDVVLLQDPNNPSYRLFKQDLNVLGKVADFHTDSEQTYLPEEIEVISCVSAVSQAKALPKILEQLNVLNHDEDSLDTAVILSNEQHLLPIISSIPDDYKTLNISMGYPLERTPVAVMINKWKSLVIISRSGAYWPADKVVSLLGSEILSSFIPEFKAVIKSFYSNNNFYYTIDELLQTIDIGELNISSTELFADCKEVFKDKNLDALISKYQTLWQLEGYTKEAVQYEIIKRSIILSLLSSKDNAQEFLSAMNLILQGLFELSQINKQIQEEQKEEMLNSLESLFEGEEESTQEKAVILSNFDEEFIHHYIRLSNRLISIIERYPKIELNAVSSIKLFEALAHDIKIPFEGDPLRGLQIMGLLEARMLNFDNMIYMSASEGNLPKSSNNQSLIPYTLQIGYGLPSKQELEAISAYQFFQSIGRCKKLILIYGEDDGLGSHGEESRYIKQLRYLYQTKITDRSIQMKPNPMKREESIILKDELIYNKIKKFLVHEAEQEDKGGKQKHLSISKLSTYASCPLNFYYEHIEDAKKESLPDMLTSPDIYGNILHKAMETLYADFIDKQVNAQMLDSIDNDLLILKTINQIKKDEDYTTSNKEWQELINSSLLQHIKNIINFDKKEEFIYLGSEIYISWHKDLTLKDNQDVQVSFRGLIDRIDLVKNDDGNFNKIRILDYKTGKDQLKPINLLSSAGLDEFYLETFLKNSSKFKAMFQTLFYCEMLLSGDVKTESSKKTILANGEVTYTTIKHNVLEACLRDLRSASPMKQLYVGIYSVPSISKDPDFVPYVHYKDKAYSKETYLSHYNELIRERINYAYDELLKELFDPDIPFQIRNKNNCNYCVHL